MDFAEQRWPECEGPSDCFIPPHAVSGGKTPPNLFLLGFRPKLNATAYKNLFRPVIEGLPSPSPHVEGGGGGYRRIGKKLQIQKMVDMIPWGSRVQGTQQTPNQKKPAASGRGCSRGCPKKAVWEKPTPPPPPQCRSCLGPEVWEGLGHPPLQLGGLRVEGILSLAQPQLAPSKWVLRGLGTTPGGSHCPVAPNIAIPVLLLSRRVSDGFSRHMDHLTTSRVPNSS